jgi:hypothetical protein
LQLNFRSYQQIGGSRKLKIAGRIEKKYFNTPQRWFANANLVKTNR